MEAEVAELAAHLGATAKCNVVGSIALVLPKAFSTGAAAGVRLIDDKRSFVLTSHTTELVDEVVRGSRSCLPMRGLNDNGAHFSLLHLRAHRLRD